MARRRNLRPLPMEAQWQPTARRLPVVNPPMWLEQAEPTNQGLPRAQALRMRSYQPKAKPKRHHLTHLNVLGGPPVAVSNEILWAQPRQPLPHYRGDPQLPIIYHQPSTPKFEAYTFRYLDHNNQVREDCLLESVGKHIPVGRVLPSTFQQPSGRFAHPCPLQDVVHHKQWPF